MTPIGCTLLLRCMGTTAQMPGHEDGMAIQTSRKRLGLMLAAVMVLWAGFSGYVWWAMKQPPEKFGRVMASLPTPAYFLFPFETMWTRARAGQLQVGDTAPNFSLTKQDKSGTVELAALTRQQPAVLVFGSYT